MIVVWVLTGIAALMAVMGIVFSRGYKQVAKRFDADLVAFGLKDFNDRLKREIADNTRPMADLALTRHMMSVLRHIKTLTVPAGEVALIVPQTPNDLRACQELAKLNRLVAAPDGKNFVVGTMKDSASPGSGTGSSLG